MSPENWCIVPINSLNQCWGQKCPVQLGGLLESRPDAIRQWAVASTAEFDPLRPFPTYKDPSAGLFDLATGRALTNASQGGPASGVLVSVAADWGSGTCEARVVSKLMQADSPEITIHMGDVYYTGRPAEFKSNMLGEPPNKNQIGVSFARGKRATFFMNGNHEVISGCGGLMDVGFNSTGQETTYIGWQSDSWRFIVLDTAYECYSKLSGGSRVVPMTTTAPQPQAVIEWLKNVVRLGDASDKRGIVLFTHHQPISDFAFAYLGTAKQLAEFLPKGKQVLWFAGHEHRLAFYDEAVVNGTNFSTIMRLVGNGGMYNMIVNSSRVTVLSGHDNRVYQRIPNDVHGDDEVGFNGFFKINVEGPKLDISYLTGKCKASSCDDGYDENEGTLVAQEEVKVDLKTGRLTSDLRMTGELTTVRGRPQLGIVPTVGSMPRPKVSRDETVIAV